MDNRSARIAAFSCALMICIQWSTIGQTLHGLNTFILKDSSRHHVTVSGEYSTNSSALTNSFLNAVLFGKKITTEEKTHTEKRLKKENRFGYLIENHIAYTGKLPKHELAIRASYRELDFGHMRFSDDFFKLVMYGNKPYAGEELALNDFEFTRRSYQVLSLGLGKTIDSNLFVSASAGLVHGSSFQTIQLNDAQLFTEEDGRYIDFQGDYSNASSISDSRYGGKAWGTAFSFEVLKHFENLESSLRLRVLDLGFAKWQNVSFYDTTNASYRFEGYVVDDIFNAENGNENNEDSVETVEDILGLEREETTLLVSLPTRFEVDFIQPMGNLELLTGFRYIFNANYFPRLYVQPRYALGKGISAKVTLSVGGYGNVDLGLGLIGKLGRRTNVNLDIYYVEALFAPKLTAGQAVNFSLSRQF